MHFDARVLGHRCGEIYKWQSSYYNGRMDEFSAEALLARESNDAFDAFAAKNKSFILGCASKSLKRYVRETDDEWSVALIAFHEAVNVYNPNKGNFSSFAGVVIKRRLLDEERRRVGYGAEIPVRPETLAEGYSEEEESESGEEQIAVRIRKQGDAQSPDNAGTTPLQDEIAAMQDILGEYSFSFFELTECSPRSRKTREACAGAVRRLLETEGLYAKMQKSHSLPIRELCDGTGLPRKLMDRHRKYIIAVTEILKGDFPLLADYLKDLKK